MPEDNTNDQKKPEESKNDLKTLTTELIRNPQPGLVFIVILAILNMDFWVIVFGGANALQKWFYLYGYLTFFDNKIGNFLIKFTIASVFSVVYSNWINLLKSTYDWIARKVKILKSKEDRLHDLQVKYNKLEEEKNELKKTNYTLQVFHDKYEPKVAQLTKEQEALDEILTYYRTASAKTANFYAECNVLHLKKPYLGIYFLFQSISNYYDSKLGFNGILPIGVVVLVNLESVECLQPQNLAMNMYSLLYPKDSQNVDNFPKGYEGEVLVTLLEFNYLVSKSYYLLDLVQNLHIRKNQVDRRAFIDDYTNEDRSVSDQLQQFLKLMLNDIEDGGGKIFVFLVFCLIEIQNLAMPVDDPNVRYREYSDLINNVFKMQHEQAREFIKTHEEVIKKLFNLPTNEAEEENNN
jgi:hypothetical protein